MVLQSIAGTVSTHSSLRSILLSTNLEANSTGPIC
jgi:hypothetical protein